MFTPATRKSRPPPQKGRNPAQAGPDSPSTPAAESRFPGTAVPSRPATGTPAPWASRLSVLARIPTANRTDKGFDADQTQPVYVAEFPQVVRNAQANYLQKNVDAVFCGGMDKGSLLSWIICGNQLFIWRFLSNSVPRKCVILDIPYFALAYGNNDRNLTRGHWLLCFLKWDSTCVGMDKSLGPCSPIGVVAYNQERGAIVYWPDICSESVGTPVVSLPSLEEFDKNASPHQEITEAKGSQESNQTGNGLWSGSSFFNSLIVSPIPSSSYKCIGLALSSSGELWRLCFEPLKIFRERISRVVTSPCFQNGEVGQPPINKDYATSLVWRFQHETSEKSSREFFLLTDHEIQCWNILLEGSGYVTKLWSHELVGTDGDSGIKKDLAGQKHVWLLDMQVDDRGREFTILVATICKDRVSSSSYTQYSLLTMQYRSGQNISSENYSSANERILEKKVRPQVIIPKARVEDEKFLFSMRLRVGGKPSGSAVILSGDGTATVSNYWRGSTRLYQFDLPWDAGKVLDASVIPSMGESEEGAWVVLTEKAGIWAIPDKAVLLGGVEPPERSLSRKGSSNGRATEEKGISVADGNIVFRRASSETWNAGDKQRAQLSSISQRSAQDEEAEVLLGRLFHDFLLTGKVEGVFEKLEKSGAFEKEGAMNVFARMSKSIVDTLAKHWTTTRGADFVVSAAVSSQLFDKQQKHERLLQFLALSKCHEELSTRQGNSLHTILEHGEKLSGIIQLRELQNLLSQKRSGGNDSPSSLLANEVTGSLWDLIQLVGEKARRNAVLLMDRDNAEVFYSRASDLEELFYCLSHDMHYVMDRDNPPMIQIQRTCEISNACISLIVAAMRYRNEHQTWYPSPEGLIHWNCKPVVRSGLWSIASLIIQLLKEAPVIDKSVKFDLVSQLEGLADILLEAYNALVIVKMERGEKYKGLGEEYCNRRDEILCTLYQQLKNFVDAKYQDLYKGTEDPELKRSIFREASGHLLAIAKQHEGYQTLWDICYDLNDTELLRSLMRQSMGPQGGFSYFVFRQLYEQRRYSTLLRLGEEFQEELLIFLKQHKELLWFHEMFLNQLSSASETLHALALSQDDASASMTEKTDVPDCPEQGSSLADRRIFLNLSKIAAAAGKDAGFAIKIQRIEADLHMLQLQERIMGQFQESVAGQNFNKLLHPGELIELCLKSKSRELSLLAFEVFAWTSSSFRESNRSLLVECWMNAADQDDWSAIYQKSVVEGWSDEVSLQFLKETVLFQASIRCYGPGAEVYGGEFEEALPPQKEDEEPSDLKGSGSSVEEILMQHKDFPDAGKLMVTAIVMGKAGADAIPDEDIMRELQ